MTMTILEMVHGHFRDAGRGVTVLGIVDDYLMTDI